ncbi:MAG: putative hydrolase of the superfamily [Acidobacteriota bacterium]|jgi:putative hydrolase of the HAD superfamily|nr:putative hydrolase of the superfamily [Acidobacteriota bacterium]
MPLRAIAFDLWETLLTDTPELSRAQEELRLERMERALVARGFSAVAHRIEEAYRKLWRRCLELYWSVDRDVPCRRQIEHFLEALELDPATFEEEVLAELEHAYAMAAVEIPPKVVDGAAEVISTLKQRGFRVGLISNTGRTPGYALRDVLDKLGLGASIDVMLFSNEHGECKPSASIFEELRRGLDVAYDELMFVGDNLYVDVHGAQRLGMRGVHFVPPVRGTAVAPPFEHGLEIVADATISDLRELLTLV